MEFEWDPRKAETNLSKHGIDFQDAIRIFGGNVVIGSSDREGEPRWEAVGLLGAIMVTVIYTRRGDRTRIISARRARENERRAYRQVYPRGRQGG